MSKFSFCDGTMLYRILDDLAMLEFLHFLMARATGRDEYTVSILQRMYEEVKKLCK